MTTIKIPVAWCDNLGIKAHRVRLPFGLPPFESTDPFALAGQIQTLLAAFTPILQAIDCVTKVITLVKAVATLDPFQIEPALEKIVDCATVILPTYIIPAQLIVFLQFAVDLVQLAIDVLEQLITDLEHLAQLRITENDLLASLDDALRASGHCVKEANDQVAIGLAAKLSSIQGFLVLVNLMLSLAGQDPIEVDAGLFVPEELHTVIDALQSALEALNSLPGMS